MQIQLEPTFCATIYVGLVEGYGGRKHSQDEAEDMLREYCDDVGLCVTVTSTKYIYTGGSEDGLIIGLINYPRFPATADKIKDTATEIAQALIGRLGQKRITIVCSDETIMIGGK